MKKVLLLIFFLLFIIKIFAHHIVGGEIFYKYLGAGASPGTSIYHISLRLFRDCDVPCGEGTSTACLPASVAIGVYSLFSPYKLFHRIDMPLTDSSAITLSSYPNCIAVKPSVCYEIKTYSVDVTLTDFDDGYILAYQNCCRADAWNQYGLAPTLGGAPGATYTANMPGKKILPGEHNNSAVFKLKDTALTCLESKFAIDFSAVDADKDSLSYAFAPAYDGGIFFSDGCTLDPFNGFVCDNTFAGPPPYNFITYRTMSGFTGTQPLGDGVSIDPATGLISGVAPSQPGHYIVNVIAYEWRRGKIIASHQKDFIIHVEDCDIPRAKLQPSYITCDGYNLTFEDESKSPLINSYYWDFGDPNNLNDTSTKAKPNYNYSDTGVYTVTLYTNKGQQCSDSGTTLAKVYPGFVTDFNSQGGCILSPFQFTDFTTSKYGAVNNWRWDFGDFSTLADTSLLQNPKYAYADIQQVLVQLISGDSKGCVDTATKILRVYDSVPLHLSFNDTLICGNDTLKLYSIDSIPSSAAITWSPSINISNTNIASPFVYPNATTTYHVSVNDNGCTNQDSATINVIKNIVLNAGNDTTICLTDSVQLHPQTNALYFAWSPAININDASAKELVVLPLTNTLYKVVATVSKCIAYDSIQINVSPYPQVISYGDTTICFGKTTSISAHTNADNFLWAPSNSLLHANTLTPTAGPQATTGYVITVHNLQGCTKPVSDTTTVTVMPKVNAYAGKDTVIVADQPLQLNATGGTNYMWSPATGMNNPNIPNPIVVLGAGYDTVLYHVKITTAENCVGNDDIKVIVFKTKPDIFIASAFTPNHDGLNDVLKPIVIGMKQFNYFRVYNRWGKMIYNTSEIGKGWDGTLSGSPQQGGTYVYIAQAVDYTGKLINKKGTVVLIR